MRIGIVAVDTRGGVQPYAALGLGLQAAGHEVRLIVPADSHRMVTGWGLEAVALSGSMQDGARQAAAVGGAGTTAAALRAGTPAVVIPFGVDQPFWGARVAALGAGPSPIPLRALTTERLADAVQIVSTDEGMRARAVELGRAIRSENGVAHAVAAFDDLQAHLDLA